MPTMFKVLALVSSKDYLPPPANHPPTQFLSRSFWFILFRLHIPCHFCTPAAVSTHTGMPVEFGTFTHQQNSCLLLPQTDREILACDNFSNRISFPWLHNGCLGDTVLDLAPKLEHNPSCGCGHCWRQQLTFFVTTHTQMFISKEKKKTQILCYQDCTFMQCESEWFPVNIRVW